MKMLQEHGYSKTGLETISPVVGHNVLQHTEILLNISLPFNFYSQGF